MERARVSRDRGRPRRTALAVAVGAVVMLAGCDLGAPAVEYPTYGSTGRVVGSGDVDGDGDIDLVTSGDGAGFGVLVNAGSGSFAPTIVAHIACPAGGEPRTCTQFVTGTADVDGDGAVDVLMRTVQVDTDSGEESVAVGYRRSDAGEFAAPLYLATATYPEVAPTLSFGEVTGDGRLDAIVVDSPFGVRTIRIRVGLTDGSFGPLQSTPYPARSMLFDVSVGDMDGDGRGDLVLGGLCLLGGAGEDQYAGCFTVLRSDGAGRFSEGPARFVPDTAVDSLWPVLGDVDGDGDLDVVAGTQGIAQADGGGPVGYLAIALGDGSGGLATPVLQEATTETGSVRLADFDGDGLPDVLAETAVPADSSDPAYGRVWFGDGTGRFVDPHLLPTGRAVVDDLDGDGRPDVATQEPGRTRVFLNRWDGRPG